MSMNESLPSPSARRLAAVLAVIGWAALALQLVLSIRVATNGGQSAGWGVFMYLGYFTILCNMLVALALTAAATGAASAFWRFFRDPGVTTAIATNIAIVGMTYFGILRHVWSPQGLLWLCDVTLHYVMPIVFLVYWWIAVPARGLPWLRILRWWIFPLAYLVYALVRGAIAGVYPYPFVDVNALGYPRTAVNSAALLIGFSVVAALLIAIGHRKPMPKKV